METVGEEEDVLFIGKRVGKMKIASIEGSYYILQCDCEGPTSRYKRQTLLRQFPEMCKRCAKNKYTNGFCKTGEVVQRSYHQNEKDMIVEFLKKR